MENACAEGTVQPQKRYYTLAAAADDAEVAVLEALELTPAAAQKLPFNRPTGPLSAALGPVIKRTAPGRGHPGGPSRRVQGTTLQSFQAIAQAKLPWSAYFAAARACWMRPRLRHGAATLDAPAGALAAAVDAIDENFTVLLAFRQADGRLPGEVPEYAAFLQAVLATKKYATELARAQPGQTCPLCDRAPVDLYPNALRGAGINFANVDRYGAFPSLDAAAAWKSFALCLECADALFIYWQHVARRFLVQVAGEKVLAVPSPPLAPARPGSSSGQPAAAADPGAHSPESPLTRILQGPGPGTSLTLLWAEFGQRIDDVRGVVSGIQPRRLQELERACAAFNLLEHRLFPEVALGEFSCDVGLSLLGPLLDRPGGMKAQRDNDSRRLFDLRRDLAEALYHGRRLPEGRFWDQAHVTARWHWRAALEGERPTLGLLYEGGSDGTGAGFLTVAGWARQLARFLSFCRAVGGLAAPEEACLYRPQCDVLGPYCGALSGIDSPAKAFAFVLGILYGKLLQIVVARRGNPRPPALAWPRRLTLAGRDLPGLFGRVRAPLLAVDGSPRVRAMVGELAALGERLGGHAPLGAAEASYFLLLGQALAVKVLPSNPDPGNDDA